MCLFADMISGVTNWLIWSIINFGFAGIAFAIATYVMYRYITSREEIYKADLAQTQNFYEAEVDKLHKILLQEQNELKVQYSTDLAYRDQDRENSIILIRADYEEKLHVLYGECDVLKTMLTEERVNRDEILKSDHEHHKTLLRAKEAWFQEVVEKMKTSEQEVLQGKNALISKHENNLTISHGEIAQLTLDIQTLERKLKAEIETANSFKSEYTRICSQDILNREEIQRLNNIILAKNTYINQLQQENVETLKVEIETANFFRRKVDSEREARKQLIQMLGDTVIAELDALKSRLLDSIMESHNDAY